MTIYTVLTPDRLQEIDDELTGENFHSEADMLMPLLEAVAVMEDLLREYAEHQGLGDVQEEILEALRAMEKAVARCHP